MTWPQISESTFLSKLLSQNSWKTAQLSKTLCNNAPLTVQRFEHNALSLEFPGAVFSLNLLEAPSLFREYLIFIFLWFLNHRVFDKFIQFNSCVRSASHHFYCVNGFTDTPSRRVWPWQCSKWAYDSISPICVATPVSTNHVGCPIMTLKFTIRYSSIRTRAP